jgi:hypothetical protein
MDYSFNVFRHRPVFGLHYIGIASYVTPKAWPPSSTFQPTFSIEFP